MLYNLKLQEFIFILYSFLVNFVFGKLFHVSWVCECCNNTNFCFNKKKEQKTLMIKNRLFFASYRHAQLHVDRGKGLSYEGLTYEIISTPKRFASSIKYLLYSWILVKIKCYSFQLEPIEQISCNTTIEYYLDKPNIIYI
jgi:hypothetical protein